MSKNEQLTDRYIYAVSRDMPEATRADIATELRSTIADTIEDHVANGADPAQAEREVLTSLGSPTAFATRYATGPTQLIGPRYYFVWKRVTFNVLIWVVPIISVIAALAEALDENSMTNVVTTLLGTAFSVALHVAFWTTLSFAIVDRVTHNDDQKFRAGAGAEPRPVVVLATAADRGVHRLGCARDMEVPVRLDDRDRCFGCNTFSRSHSVIGLLGSNRTTLECGVHREGWHGFRGPHDHDEHRYRRRDCCGPLGDRRSAGGADQ